MGAEFAFPAAAVIALAASFLLASRLERLAARLHLSEGALGLVVAVAADSPEITSAITASAHGHRGIGAGVVLGSNVFNIAALLGLGAIVAGRIDLHRRVVVLEGFVAVWVALIAVLVVVAGVAPGAGLALALAVVVPYGVMVVAPAPRRRVLVRPARVARWLRRAVEEETLELSEAIRPVKPGRFDGLVAAVSVVVVVGASVVMERAAERLGATFHLSALVVGGIVLAAVTSLPNAVGAVYLSRRGRGAAVLSEAMNSNMINVVAGLLLPGIFVGIDARSGGGVLLAASYGAFCVASLALAYAYRGLRGTWGFVIVAGYGLFVLAAVLS